MTFHVWTWTERHLLHYQFQACVITRTVPHNASIDLLSSILKKLGFSVSCSSCSLLWQLATCFLNSSLKVTASLSQFMWQWHHSAEAAFLLQYYLLSQRTLWTIIVSPPSLYFTACKQVRSSISSPTYLFSILFQSECIFPKHRW